MSQLKDLKMFLTTEEEPDGKQERRKRRVRITSQPALGR